jgi:hypothetical protein
MRCNGPPAVRAAFLHHAEGELLCNFCYQTFTRFDRWSLSVDAISRQRSAIDLEPSHALPAKSRFSVETFTFSPSLMKRGTRISRPVSSRAVLVPPPDESPRTAGSV